MVTLLLVASLLSASAPVDNRCDPLRSPLRVRLTIASGEWRSAEPVIRQLVEETWRPTGLPIEWVDDAEARWDAIDFWIAVVHTTITDPEGGVLGFVRFNGDQPGPLARVSIDAALLWVRNYQARRLKTTLTALGDRLDNPDLIHRVLGYTAAHELGHFVLSMKTHASSGIMKPTYRQPEALFEQESWQLDQRNVMRLQQRIAGGCGVRAP